MRVFDLIKNTFFTCFIITILIIIFYIIRYLLNKNFKKNCSFLKQLETSTLSLVASFLSADIQNVVAAYKSVPKFVLQLTVDVFLGLFEGDVHVTVQARQNT